MVNQDTAKRVKTRLTKQVNRHLDRLEEEMHKNSEYVQYAPDSIKSEAFKVIAEAYDIAKELSTDNTVTFLVYPLDDEEVDLDEYRFDIWKDATTQLKILIDRLTMVHSAHGEFMTGLAGIV